MKDGELYRTPQMKALSPQTQRRHDLYRLTGKPELGHTEAPLSRSSARIRGIAILAHKPFGICAVHLFHEVALTFRSHGCFADSQHVANSAKVLGQVRITDFVWLVPANRRRCILSELFSFRAVSVGTHWADDGQT